MNVRLVEEEIQRMIMERNMDILVLIERKLRVEEVRDLEAKSY